MHNMVGSDVTCWGDEGKAPYPEPPWPPCRGRHGRQDLMAELDECIGEFLWGSMVFYRQWGVQARDLLLRPLNGALRPCTPAHFQRLSVFCC